MRTKLVKLGKIAVGALMISAFCFSQAEAQFSKAVVVLKGVVRTEETNKPHSVKVSVRAAGDKAVEITASTSNSESGSYLVVLQSGKKYWVHLEGEDIITKDELIETPVATKTEQMVKDFSVTTITVANHSEEKASIK
ncbi:MAG: hypothetical protein ABI778_07840 [Ignavibacteriota bacterium]